MLFPLCYTGPCTIVFDVAQAPVTCHLGRIICHDLGQEHEGNLVNFNKSLKPPRLPKGVRYGR